jgi:phage gpG-like protein
MDELQDLLYGLVQNLVMEITQELAETSNIPVSEGGVMPVKTGRLRSSLMMTQIGDDTVDLTYNTPYASLIHDGGGKYKAQRYLAIPLEEIFSDLPRRIEKSFDALGSKLGGGLSVKIEPATII